MSEVSEASDAGELPPFRRRLGRYVLLAEIGRGGMGRVYAAYDPELDRKLAIKLLHQHAGATDEEGQLRLLREAQALARLSHPNVVAVHDVGVADGSVFLAMEFVDGQTLRQWAGLGHGEDGGERAGALRPWREVVAMFVQAGRGLAAAHAADLVHRDFKPDNVLVGADGRAQVLDFGIARAGGDRPSSVEHPTSPDHGGGLEDDAAEVLAGLDTVVGTGTRPGTEPSLAIGSTISQLSTGTGLLSSELTQVGARVGTPAYMAPEQHRGQVADARSDQFSFAVGLYEALVGHRPFAGDSVTALMMAILSAKLRPPPDERKLPRWLLQALTRALHADPEQRWPDMDALLRELERDRQRGRRRAVMGVSLFAAAALGGFAPRLFADAPADACVGVEASVDAAWSANRSAELVAAFEATGPDYARESGRRVAATLDRYAEELGAAQVDACEREASGEGTHAEIACLDGLTVRLHAVVDVLARADAAVVEKGQDLVSELPEVASCRGQANRYGTVAPPAEADAAAVTELTRELVGAQVALDAYASADALTAAAAILTRAEAIDYLPIRARAHAQVGRARLALADADAAVEALEQAAWLARASGDARLELESELTLISALRSAGAFDRAQRQAQRTAALVLRLDPGGLFDATLRLLIASVHVERGEYEQAAVHELEAITLYEANGLHDDPRLARAVNSHAGTLKQLGQLEPARAEAERALGIYERLYGPDHPAVAGPLLNLGRVSRALDQFDAAERDYLRAIDIIARAEGPDVPRLGSYYNNLGNVYLDMGRDEAAEAALERALAIREREFGPTHVRTAYPLLNLGSLYLDQGDHERARALLERGLAIREHAHAGGGRPMLDPLLALGRLEAEVGDYDRAVELLERALTIHAGLASGDQSPTFVVAGEFWLGVALDGRSPGDARARALVERAEAGLREDERADPRLRERVRAWLAER